VIQRRDFITLLGGVAVWPLAARAQQSALPVIGFLDQRSPDSVPPDHLRAFHRGLKETGYVERENVTIEYRWAENQTDRLPALAAELVRRQVAVIAVTSGPPAALAAKAATATIPIVFGVAQDPVRLGLVANLARPGGNMTGNSFFNTELTVKRVELLRELVPTAARMAVLVNPANTSNTEITLRDAEAAARAVGIEIIQVLHGSTSREIDAAFATFAHERPDVLLVGGDGFFTSRRVQLANLASRYALPTTFGAREIVEAGGLMSYGNSIAESWYQTGVYAGRILKGAKPADLPVVQSTKFELVINLQTAKLLGIDVPPSLLAIADEVIE